MNNVRWALIVSWMAGTLNLSAQRQVVVADALTHEPVAQASLYARTDGQFRSAISDDNGRATVGFAFQRLTVSHLNYERKTVSRLPDTLFLEPRYRQTAEVVVTNREPAWIRPKLREVIKKKQRHYFYTPRTLAYDYQTQSIADRSYYQFASAGLLRMRSCEQEQYALCQQKSEIVALDSTRLTDMANLRRMLYEDFVWELDNSFLRSHRFSENGDYEGRNKNEIELTFRPKNRNGDDRGRMVIDTARCVILSARRTTGTATNKAERTSSFLMTWAWLMTGYKIDKWKREYRVRYDEAEDGLYPAEVSYKLYMENTDHDTDEAGQAYHRQTGGGFPNMEATLRLRPVEGALPADSAQWLTLPPSWYLRLSSDKERQQEIELSNMPATFRRY